jgi:hypothetical protein
VLRLEPVQVIDGALRQRYIAALQAADNHDIDPLLAPLSNAESRGFGGGPRFASTV